MISSRLSVFLSTADCGSFNKAAEKLFVTPAAVMKQFNALEDQLGVKLAERTYRGIKLTEAGEVIYRQGKIMSELAREAAEEARRAAAESSCILRVGSSLLNPCKPFMDLWNEVSRDFPEFKISVVPFDDEHSGILSVIERIGTDFDIIVGVCDSAKWLERCNMLKLGAYKKCIAVPAGHRLAGKKKLKISDLFGETLMMVKAGDSPINDSIRAELEKYPQIKIEDTDHYYDISVYNKCVRTGSLLLNLECWSNIHPSLVTIPVEWEYEMPYGLLYGKNPSEEVLRFIKAVETVKKATRK